MRQELSIDTVRGAFYGLALLCGIAFLVAILGFWQEDQALFFGTLGLAWFALARSWDLENRVGALEERIDELESLH